MPKRVGIALGVVVVAAIGIVSLWVYQSGHSDQLCDVCYRPMHQETYYRVHSTGGQVTELCCPRCGLRYQYGREDVASADVADYHTKEILNAKEAFFVEGSEVHACVHDRTVRHDLEGSQYTLDWDRCLPSLVAFETREAAEAFRRTRGGAVLTYSELVAEGF